MNLSTDPSLDVNLLRWIGTGPYHGADVVEVLDLAGSRPARSRAGIRSSSLAERVARGLTGPGRLPGHPPPGAWVPMNGIVFDWLTETFHSRPDLTWQLTHNHAVDNATCLRAAREFGMQASWTWSSSPACT